MRLYPNEETYPKAMLKHLENIDAKADDVPLTDAEAEALARYLYGDEWFESETEL
jgi:hypothetical protein